MKRTIVAVCCCVTVLMGAGCKKSNSANKNGALSGGKGGSASLTVTPEHHEQFVDSCIVYIKYATNDAPTDGVYDDSVACVKIDTTPVAIFTNLQAGSYYLLAEGYHAGYTPPYVKGGLPHAIGKSTDSDRFFMATYSYNK